MPKQKGLVLLWSVILLHLMMVALFMAREGSVLALQLAYQQEARLDTEVNVENALTSLLQKLERGEVMAAECWLTQPLLTQDEIAADLPCVIGKGSRFALAIWGMESCVALPGQPPGVQYLQVTVASRGRDTGDKLVLQSSLAVPELSQFPCQKIRALAGARQTWRIYKF